MTKVHSYSARLLVVLALSPLLLTGCRAFSSRSPELSAAEDELRSQESVIVKLQRDVSSLQSELVASQREISSLRKSATAGSDIAQTSFLSEQAHSTFRISKVEISSFMSGGMDRDETPGDEVLSVLLSPRDATGQILRADGTIEMTIYDLSKPGDQQLLGTWTFDEDLARKQWHSGLIGKGFHLNIKWRTPPSSDEVLVHCRFTTVDNRSFDTKTSLTVTPEVAAEFKLTKSSQ